jgi:hypothetical protein
MKISELVAVLNDRRERHGDVDVIVMWETTTHEITLRCIYLRKDGAAIVIDADDNTYKDKFAHPDEKDRLANWEYD